MKITEAAERLAPLFLNRGYAFLYPFRRGQGLSANQAPFMQDLLKQEEASKGKDARSHLQDDVLLPEHLEDVLAALSFLKSAPGIDPHRIVIAGHSFGGLLTLLAAGRDPSLRAVVTFGAAANSWKRSSKVRDLLLAAADNTTAPVMLIQAENDYDTTPSRQLDKEFARLGKPHLLKLYPPLGDSMDHGHNLLYEAVSVWEDDVFTFLEANVKR
jgi:dipeptidyl aminopeptidase/acylaminoacyl peptidase